MLRTRPKIGGAAIAPPPSTSVASSFTEPFGCSFALVGYCNTWYFYAASNDGSSSITQSLFSFAQDYNVTNGLGYQSVILGYSQTSNSGSVSASTSSSPTIGVIAVAGSTSSGDNPYPFQLLNFEDTGQNALSLTFTLRQSSLVVLTAAASNTVPTPTLTMLPDHGSLVVDIVSTSTGGGTVALAHAASLAPQTYTITIAFSPGSDSSEMAEGHPCTSFLS